MPKKIVRIVPLVYIRSLRLSFPYHGGIESVWSVVRYQKKIPKYLVDCDKNPNHSMKIVSLKNS